jgi:hypothetical protein
MTFNKPTILALEEHREILRLFLLKGSQKLTITGIKNRIDYDRMRAGTYEGQGISTNSISQRSPGSIHRTKHITKQISQWGEWNVSHVITRCLHCSLSEARDIYRDCILPISPFDFYDPNAGNMVAIRIATPLSCKSKIYIAFTSIGYDEIYEIDNDGDGETPESKLGTKASKDNVWMVKTPFTYFDILKGGVTMEVITNYLNNLNMGYEWVFINTVTNDG